jgi:hypothetical protein
MLDTGAVVPAERIIPFHYIISRGLLRKAESARLPPQQWPLVAPLVDQALSDRNVPTVPHLETWLELAKQCGVLPYAASARCALEFVRTHGANIVGTMLGAPEDGVGIDSSELWSIKEGHTSSVWVVTIETRVTPQPVVFVLDVARDIIAGDELRHVAADLDALSTRDPSRVTRVLGRGEIALSESTVAVVANTWVSDSNEIHVLRDGRAVAVDHFFGDPRQPELAASFAIREGWDSDDLWAAMLRSWIALGDWRRPAGPVLLPNVQINEGDWVIANGVAILCGVTPGPLILSCRDALAACLTLSATAGHEGPRITWSNQERAWQIVREAAATGAYPALNQSLHL